MLNPDEKESFTIERDVNVIPIFDNKEHLRQVVRIYGKHAFNSIVINDEMLEFIIANFINRSFFDESGKMYATIPNGVGLNQDQNAQRDLQIQSLALFFDLYVTNFTDNNIVVRPIDDAKGQGSYGVLLPYYKDGIQVPKKLIKFLTNTDNVTGTKTIHFTQNVNNKELYLWMIEFCTFVIIMGIFIYMDCNLVINDADRNTCIMNKYQNVFQRANKAKNYFLSYCSFLAVIDRPFIQHIPMSDPKTFVIGYVVEQYENTLTKKINDGLIRDEDSRDVFSLFIQVCVILRKINDLGKFGITISHRDMSNNNIMYTINPMSKNKFRIKLIDFGFMCCNIKFKDNTTFVIGDHPFANRYGLNKCDKPHLDIILFLVWCMRYSAVVINFLERISGVKLMERLVSVVTFDDPQNMDYLNEKDDGDYTYSPWDYSAMVDVAIKNKIANGMLSPENTLTHNKINELFNRVFDIINDIASTVDQQYKPEIVDNGDIKMFDIHGYKNPARVRYNMGKFYQLYNQNKLRYLKLSRKHLMNQPQMRP